MRITLSRLVARVWACELLLVLGCPQAAGQCLEQELNEPDPRLGDDFGRAVAMSGDTAVVGDPYGPDGYGAAYVSTRIEGKWIQQETLAPPTPQFDDSFGSSISIDGDLIVVGAGGRDADVFTLASGAVFLFRWDAGWQYDTMLVASDAESFSTFGTSVALDGDALVVGSAGKNEDGELHAGAAYAFGYNGTAWTEEAKFVDTEPGALDLFGIAVAIRSNVALIGASGDSPHNAGSATVYRRVDGVWTFEQKLTALDASSGDRLGASVALSADATLAVLGAREADGQTGALYVFRLDGDTWQQVAKLTPANAEGPFAFLGWAVAIDSATLSIIGGAPGDYAQGFESGAAYLFHSTGSGWEQAAKLVSPEYGALQGFGKAISLDGDRALIGSPGQLSGSAHVFAGMKNADCNANGTPDGCDLLNGDAADANDNGVPDECESTGDLNGDGAVNVEDLVMLILAWGPCETCPPLCTGDLDGDCEIAAADLDLLIQSWSQVP